jgi:hypothetical protein
MRKTLIAMLAAAAVLVMGGALGATAQTGADASDENESAVIERPLRVPMLERVLDEMVEDGVIDADHATAIAEWLANRRAELHAARDEWRDAWTAAWEDGVLTADEAADLPFADRLLADDGPFAEAWEDGQLTREEFDSARPRLPARRGLGHHRLGGLFNGSPTDGDSA